MKKKLIDFYGVELSKEEVEAIIAWLNHPEGILFNKIVKALLNASERNAMRDPVQGSDWHLFVAQREQFLGEAKGLRKIAQIARALGERI